MKKIKNVEYEAFILFFICIILTVTIVYAISNMINLRHLNKNFDLKLIEHQSLHNRKKQIIENQNYEHTKLIKVLRKKHSRFIQENNIKQNKPKLKEIDKYFNNKIIPSIKSVLTKNDDLFNNNKNNKIYADNRWSYI